MINERGVKPLKDILNFIGGWPIIDGEAWDKAAWNWEDSILKLRKLITKRTDNIFRKPKEPRDKEDDVRTFVSFKYNFYYIDIPIALIFNNRNISFTEKF